VFCGNPLKALKARKHHEQVCFHDVSFVYFTR
jgi:hypothetical protein